MCVTAIQVEDTSLSENLPGWPLHYYSNDTSIQAFCSY
jgi:hypothetical protein